MDDGGRTVGDVSACEHTFAACHAVGIFTSEDIAAVIDFDAFCRRYDSCRRRTADSQNHAVGRHGRASALAFDGDMAQAVGLGAFDFDYR